MSKAKQHDFSKLVENKITKALAEEAKKDTCQGEHEWGYAPYATNGCCRICSKYPTTSIQKVVQETLLHFR